jgi:hypothetical protein
MPDAGLALINFSGIRAIIFVHHAFPATESKRRTGQELKARRQR